MRAGDSPPISPRNADGKKIDRESKGGEFGSETIWQFLGKGRRKDPSGVRRLDAALDEARHEVVPVKRRQDSASLHRGRWAATQADGPTPRLNKAASSRRTPNCVRERLAPKRSKGRPIWSAAARRRFGRSQTRGRTGQATPGQRNRSSGGGGLRSKQAGHSLD